MMDSHILQMQANSMCHTVFLFITQQTVCSNIANNYVNASVQDFIMYYKIHNKISPRWLLYHTKTKSQTIHFAYKDI